MDREIERERTAFAALDKAAQDLKQHMDYLWRLGDGHGGAILCQIAEVAGIDYFASLEPIESAGRTKAKIGPSLAKRVFERDAYRCLHCGTHLNLTCDHIIPESKGGPTSYANLQTLCGPCNSSKGVR